MPGIYCRPIGRRKFLKASLVAGAGVMICATRASGDATSLDGEVHLALLSDTHIGPGEAAKDPRGFDPCAQLKPVVPAIVAASPGGVILNGDAASRQGLVEDYKELATLLEPLGGVAPVYIGFGNHDHRDNFKAAFASAAGVDAGVSNHRVLVIDEPVLRFIVLDSLLYTNTMSGLLGERQRAWLTDYLKAHADKPVVLFVHHTLGDGDGDLFDADRLFAIIEPHRHVKAIFYGHSHAWAIEERQGVKMINLPSLGYNFWEGEPVGWVDARFRRNGVDLTLHAIAGKRAGDGKTSRVAWS